MENRRDPAVAGAFYPAEKAALLAAVDRCLQQTDAPRQAKLVVSPHAGYVYSGKVAGEVLGRAQVPDRVVLLGPKHTHLGARNAVSAARAWRFPFGDVPVDQELADRVVRDTAAVYDDLAHAEEHSIEVQIPFLWRRNPNLRITPIALGMHRIQELEAFGQDLAAVIREADEPVLVVASTDMSHQIPQSEAERLDRMAIQRILALDAAGLLETVLSRRISMCGVIPTTLGIVVAKALRAAEVELVRYATSGDVTGDLRHVVGYAGLIVC